MPRIDIADVQAWVESTKLSPTSLDTAQLDQLETEVFAKISSVYDTSGWIDKASTPRLVQVIIAKTYAGWLYDKYYSENQNNPNQYAKLVKGNAESLIQGIRDGSIEIPNVPATNAIAPSFYPNDMSSSIAPDGGGFQPQHGLRTPIPGDTSTGPAKFSMGKVF